jgi:hypothetical protein
MPQVIVCPACNASLELPDEYLGKTVRCPTCAVDFVAAPDSDAPQTAPPPPPGWGSSSPATQPRGGYRQAAGGRPAGADPRSLVSGPATLLMVSSILDLFLSLFAGVGGILMLIGSRQALRGDQPLLIIMGIMYLFISGIGMPRGLMILLGSFRLRNLTGRGFALFAAILACVPIGSCLPLSLPAGIWSLIAMNKPEVKGAFRS